MTSSHSIGFNRRTGGQLLTFASAFALAASLSQGVRAAAVAPSAPAAEPAPAVPAPDPAAVVDPSEGIEITVTAQRRSESAQNIPVAVHTVGGAQLLESTQVNNVNDIATLLPNVQAGDSGTNQPRWFIRGLGTNRTEFVTVNPVGIYFDEVYISNTYAQEAPLFDLDRVESAIGPQGTLWGKNANAGAINFISKKPTFQNEGYIHVGYGSFNHHQEEGAFGGPITDKLAFRAAFYNDSTDSWQKLLSTGKTLGSTQTIAGRISLDYKASDTVDILLNLHADRRNGVENGWNVFADPNLPVSSATYRTFYPGGYPSTPYGTINYIQAQPFRTEQVGGNAKVNIELGSLTLTSITGGESVKWSTGSSGQVPYPSSSAVFGQTPSTAQTTNSEYQLSEELRLANPTQNRWTWQVGLFGYYEHVDIDALAFTPANLLNPAATQALGTAAANTYTEWSNTLTSQNKRSFAAFASTAYNITDRFKVQGGVRWSDERVSYSTSLSALGNTAANNAQILSVGIYNNPGAPLLYAGSDHHDFKSWIYDIKPQYRLSRNVLFYLSYSHAVEAGGFTTQTNVGLSPAAYGIAGAAYSYLAPTLLQPEKLNAYEGGLKTNWFNNRLIFNVSVFDYQISDAVTNVTTPIVNLAVPGGIANGVVFRNAGKAYSRGGEIELNALLTKAWRVGVTAGYDKTKYTSQNSPTYNLLGTQIPRAPKWNVQATTSYDLALGKGSLRLAADVNWRSGFWFYPNTCYQLGVGCAAGNFGPDRNFYQNGYAVANVHVTWYPREDKKLAFSVEVLNAGDTRYYSHILAGSTTGTTTRLYAPPASAFGSVTYRF